MKLLRIRVMALLAVLLTIPAAIADDQDQYHKDAQKRYEDAQRDIIFGRPVTGGRYAAIAYSRTTGNSGYANGWVDRYEAERAALWQCRARDAEVVVYVKDGYVALAVGKDNIYGAGFGNTRQQAEAMALRECEKRTTECRLVKSLSSALGPPQVAPRPGRIVRQ